jgi:predicted nucleotidyltransferase
MPTLEEIQQVADLIGESYHPRRIILFGSFARGDAREDSDVDLLIEKETTLNPAREATDISLHVRAPFAVDYIVRTPEFIRQRLEWKDPFITDALHEGKVLYEA